MTEALTISILSIFTREIIKTCMSGVCETVAHLRLSKPYFKSLG